MYGTMGAIRAIKRWENHVHIAKMNSVRDEQRYEAIWKLKSKSAYACVDCIVYADSASFIVLYSTQSTYFAMIDALLDALSTAPSSLMIGARLAGPPSSMIDALLDALPTGPQFDPVSLNNVA